MRCLSTCASHLREITHVYVEPASRRKHLATALLNSRLSRSGRQSSITLLLTARSDEEGGLTDEQLIDWYKKVWLPEAARRWQTAG
jgi:ribosomal protein S18 acetylase RimI-like enzyme